MNFIINKLIKRGSLLFLLILSIFSVQITLAQLVSQSQDEKIKEDKKLREEEAVVELQKTEKPTKEKVDYAFKYGGWVTSYFWHFDDLDNDVDEEDWIKAIWLQDIRLWAMMELYQTFTVYSRMRYYHVENRTASDYTGESDGIYGPYLDMGYVKCDLNQRCNIPFEVTVGRQYLKLGRGIVYSDVHDGIQIKGALPNWALKTFGSKNKPHDANLDYSAPDYKKRQRRHFWGSELAYKGMPKHVFYTYSLIQKDHSYEGRPYPGGLAPYQLYHYDSQHYGLGATGEPLDSFKYWAEVIKEYGHTYTDIHETHVRLRKCNIDAWAYNLGGKYRFKFITHPVLEVETAYGSGDADRKRVTNIRRGNLFDDDNNFLYFGTYSAGYAFMPRLSNMYIYKVACSLKPFEMCNFLNLNEIAIGAKYYYYHKDKKHGGIYDIEATRNKRSIGQEVDLYLYWKVYHNLYYSMRYGLFFPGSAYPDDSDDKAKYFLARLTLLF